MKLIIFDLDHTIVDFFPLHDKTYHKIMKQVYGIKACYRKIDPAGRRIHDLIREYAVKEGVKRSVVEKNLKKAVRKYESHFNSELRNVKRHVLPGASKLIKALSKKKYKLAIVTGSLGPITKAILRRADLIKYFPVIVTSSNASTRKKEVALAIKKSGKVSEVWAIGDSTRDIEAGKANKARVISVTTGKHSRKLLLSKKPAYIFKDLKNTKKILGVIE